MKLAYKHVKYPVAVIFNAFIIVVLLAWAAGHVHSQTLAHDVLSVNASSIIWVIVLDLLVSLVYGLRLKFLLNAPFLNAWFIVCIGNGLNSILPFRLGDVIRIYCAKHYYAIQLNDMIGATIVERSFDLFLLLSIGFTAFMIGPVPFTMTFVYTLLLLSGCSFMVVLFYRLLITENSAVKKLIQKFQVLTKFMHGMQHIIVHKNKKQLMSLSALIWVGLVFIYATYFKLNLVGSALTWQAAMIMCFMTTLAFAIPYVIAGIGIFESAIIYYLINVLQVSATKAVALALVFHFVYALPQVLLMAMIFSGRKLAQMHVKLIKNRSF